MKTTLTSLFLVLVASISSTGEAKVENSLFWRTAGIGDGPVDGYSQDELTEWQRMLYNQDPSVEGVTTDYLDGLLVTTPDVATLRVASGGGIVYGFPYRSIDNIDHALETPTLGSTGWRIVLRADWEARTVRGALLQSADGIVDIPAMTQVAGYIWEIALARGIVNNTGAVTIVADERTPLGEAGRWLTETSDLADGAVTIDKIPNRTRTLFIPATGMYQLGAIEAWGVHRVYTAGWRTEKPELRAFVGNAQIPNDFVSDAVVQAIVTYAVDSGNYYFRSSVRYSGVGEDWGTHRAPFDYTEVPLIANELTLVASMDLIDAEAGDFLHLWLERNAFQPQDTGTVCYFAGWILSYTADS